MFDFWFFDVVLQTYSEAVATWLSRSQPRRHSPPSPSHTHSQIRCARHSRAFKKLSRAKYRAAVGGGGGGSSDGAASERRKHVRKVEVTSPSVGLLRYKSGRHDIRFQFSDVSTALCDLNGWLYGRIVSCIVNTVFYSCHTRWNSHQQHLQMGVEEAKSIWWYPIYVN